MVSQHSKHNFLVSQIVKLKKLPIFVFKHEKEKHYKKFPARILETCGGLKNNQPHVKGLISEISKFTFFSEQILAMMLQQHFKLNESSHFLM